VDYRDENLYRIINHGNIFRRPGHNGSSDCGGSSAADDAQATPSSSVLSLERRMNELARKYVETHDQKIVEEIYKLARELAKMEKR
jgi:hypothetical protein